MNPKNWTPRGGRVLVKPERAPAQVGTIHVPEQARERPNICTVVCWPPSVESVNPGVRIYVARYAGVEVFFDAPDGNGQEPYLVVAEEDILPVEVNDD